MEKKGKFTLMDVDEFDSWLRDTAFSRVIRLIQNHHTFIPSYSHFSGKNHFRLLESMERSHMVDRGFSEIAQNLTTFPDGKIAVCRPMDRIPAGIKGANQAGVCIEHIGDFDDGRDRMTEDQRRTVIKVNALLCREFNLAPSSGTIVYHHWYDLDSGERTDGSGKTKSCPGSAFFGGNKVPDAEANLITLISGALNSLQPAPSPATQGQRSAQVVASSLNVRSGGSSAAPVVKVLTNGVLVQVYAEADGWMRIHPVKEQWVYGRYLKYV